MTVITTLSNTINCIIEEVQKLTPLQQEQILNKIRLANYLRTNKKPIAKYDSKKIPPLQLNRLINGNMTPG